MTRLASMVDVPVLVELIQEFYEESGHQVDLNAAASAFAILLHSPQYGAAWLLDSGGEPAGYVVLTVCFSMESAGLTGFVDDLFIRPRFRRRGFGRAALMAVLEECRRRGLRTLQVVVGSSNTHAMRLYMDLGFRYPEDDRQTLMMAVDAISAA